MGNQTSKQTETSNDINYPVILIIGKTGSGKSTLGNMLCGASHNNGPFKTSSRMDSVTKECEEGTTIIEGTRYTVIDTPGIFDTDLPVETTISKITNLATNRCAHRIKAIICVFEATRFSPEQKQTLESLQSAFANERIIDYVIAVFSKPNSEQMINPNKMRRDWNNTFSKYVGSIGDRWGVSPNSEIFAPDHEVHQRCLMKIKKLINNTPGIFKDEEIRTQTDQMHQSDYTWVLVAIAGIVGVFIIVFFGVKTKLK